MANTVGRLKQGNLLIEGEVLERTPSVKNGLVAHFPFDNTEIGINYSGNILDDSTWKPGLTGTVGMFSINGDGNQIISFNNPWGRPSPVWATLGNDATSDADGGWNVTGRSIDSTKKYRLSVWIRRENAGDGRTYFGCQASTVCNLGTTTVNTNPYFYSGLKSDVPEAVDNWTLWVAYIHPSDYAGSSDPTNGVYKLDGTRTRGFTDYKWVAGQTTGGHRTYLYYSTSTTERHYWYRPRMEACDGTEPTIKELIMGMKDSLHPSTNTNTNLLPDGIAVETATTNLVSNPTIFSSGWTPYTNGNDGGFITEFGVEGLNIINRQSFCGASQSITLPSTGTYTFSVYAKPIDRTNPAINQYLYITGWGGAVTTVAADWSKAGQWQRLSVTLNCTSTAVNLYLICYGGSNAAGYNVTAQYTMPQIEANPFTTSFINGSRTGNSNIQIPFNLGSNFTLFYKFTPDMDWGDYYTTSYNKYMFYLYDKNTTKKIWLSDYHGAETRTDTLPWIGFDEFISTGTVHWHSITVDMQAKKECWFALVKNGNTWTKYLYSANGLVTSTITQSDAALSAFSPNKIEFPGEFCCTVRNLSLYNRALTDSEIKKLGGGSFSMSKEGDFYSGFTKEKPSNIVNLTTYFPLAMHAKDINQVISPSTEINTVYGDGAVWVGRGTANLYTGEYAFSGSSYGTQINENGWNKITATTSSFGSRYYVTLSSLINGSTYTGSATVYNPTSSPVVVQIDWCDTSGNSITINPFETRRISTTNSKATYDSTYRFLDIGPAVGGTIWIKDVQIENASFPSPYVGSVGGSRSGTRLEYDKSILPTGTTGTIMGWWNFNEAARTYRGINNDNDYAMLFATYGASEINKINIRSYYAWAANRWDLQTSDASGNGSYLSFYPSNGWHFVSLSWDKINKRIKLFLDNTKVSEMTSGVYLPASWDSQLFVGQWNAGVWGATNMWMKDFMVGSGYLSDAEILNVYKTQLRAYKNNSIQIQGQIREGQVL